MSDPIISVNGSPATRVDMYVPAYGVWIADVNLVDDVPGIAGSLVTVQIGDFSAKGTIDVNHAGAFALSRRLRVIGGANGWSRRVDRLSYRNDAGVRASDVALDLARDCGETITSFTGGQAVLGTHYLREAREASRTIEDLARGVPWYVDFSGSTIVAPRVTFAVNSDSVRLLEFDVRMNVATLAVDDLTTFGVGAVISDDRLDAPITVASYEVHVTADSVRVLAWCDSFDQAPIADALRKIVKHVSDNKPWGVFRYRVVTIDPGPSGRLNLQAVNPTVGLPDALSVSMSSAVGYHGTPALGSVCYVEFVGGDRADPIVRSFEGRGGPGFIPQGVVIAGDDTAPLAARQGDGVTLILPPMVFTGTIGGTPFTAVGEATAGQLLGTISAGSGKVKIGT